MCQSNKPLECTDCAQKVCITHFSSGNLANYIQRIIKDKQELSQLCVLKKHIEDNSKECNTVLSSICYHHNEPQIIDCLNFIKSCNIRFDKWYMHYAILNRKWNVISYLKKNNCPLRCQHIQSAIQVESEELIEEICIKYSQSFTEKTQKIITESLLHTTSIKLYKLLLPYMYPPTLKQLTTISQNRNYFLLYHSLQKIGLHLTQQASTKCIDILNGHILDSLTEHPQLKKGKIYGMHLNADKLTFFPEKDKYFSMCVEWLEMSPSKRYIHFIKERNTLVHNIFDRYTKVCRDEQSIIFSFL